MNKIPVFTDDPGWHGKRLQEAFAVRGFQAVFVSLKDCFLDLTADASGVVIPEFDALPKIAFVRGVPGGTLQQVITRLDILHALEMLGVRVYNTGRAVERTVDKAMTSFLLHHHAVPTPDTWVCESRHEAEKILVQETARGGALVIKPLFGSQGQGVRLIKKDDAYPLPRDMFVDGVYYLQQKIARIFYFQ